MKVAKKNWRGRKNYWGGEGAETCKSPNVDYICLQSMNDVSRDGGLGRWGLEIEAEFHTWDDIVEYLPAM